MEDTAIQCIRCGSKRVETKGKLFFFFVLLGTGSCLLWLGLLFTPILVFAILLMVASPISIIMPPTHQCNDCKKTWTKK